MFSLVRQSLKRGFIVGTLFLMIAMFAIVSALIELLIPILMPSAMLLQMLVRPSEGFSVPGVYLILPIVILNGMIYSLLFFAIAVVQQYASNKTVRRIGVFAIILAFLAMTGMFSSIYNFLQWPDKSLIFEIHG